MEKSLGHRKLGGFVFRGCQMLRSSCSDILGHWKVEQEAPSFQNMFQFEIPEVYPKAKGFHAKS